MTVPVWLIVVLALVLLMAAITTAWSLAWDLRAYRAWTRERTGAQPRHKRRQLEKNAEAEERDARNWRWHMVVLKVAGFAFLVGIPAIVIGYQMRALWMIVTGGNLVLLAVIAWAAYQLFLPKPAALREKRLPLWLTRKSR